MLTDDEEVEGISQGIAKRQRAADVTAADPKIPAAAASPNPDPIPSTIPYTHFTSARLGHVQPTVTQPKIPASNITHTTTTTSARICEGANNDFITLD